jgi:hypothetical protein
VVGIQIDAHAEFFPRLGESLELASLLESLRLKFAGGIKPVCPHLNAEEAVWAAHDYGAAEDVLFFRVEQENTILDLQEALRFRTLEAEHLADLAERSLKEMKELLKIKGVSWSGTLRFHVQCLLPSGVDSPYIMTCIFCEFYVLVKSKIKW